MQRDSRHLPAALAVSLTRSLAPPTQRDRRKPPAPHVRQCRITPGMPCRISAPTVRASEAAVSPTDSDSQPVPQASARNTRRKETAASLRPLEPPGCLLRSVGTHRGSYIIHGTYRGYIIHCLLRVRRQPPRARLVAIRVGESPCAPGPSPRPGPDPGLPARDCEQACRAFERGVGRTRRTRGGPARRAVRVVERLGHFPDPRPRGGGSAGLGPRP
jgi:hypothetical protein